MKININVYAAVKYGLEEAILLQNFYFWINHNIQKKINEKDGKIWTFTSINNLLEKYPFLTTGKIRSALESLLKIGILIKGNYNKNPYNKTSWYAFKDDTVFNEIKKLFEGEKKSSFDTDKKEPVQEMETKNTIHVPEDKKGDVCDSNKSICEINKSNKINKDNINSKLSLNNQSSEKSNNKNIFQDDKNTLISELMKRGITIFQVHSIVKNYKKEHLLTKIKQFDYVLSHFPERMKNNKGRYLFMSIKDNWIDENYKKSLLARKKRENEEKTREEAKIHEKLKQEYDLFIENECENEYLTLSDKEKEFIDIEIKKELNNSTLIMSNELLYLAGLEAKRVLSVMERVKGRVMGFEEFCRCSFIK